MQIAKWIIAFIAIANFGGFVADALVPATAKQHLWNPLWPPHAKFHNGQTMLMGIFGGSISLILLFGSRVLSLPDLLIAAVTAVNYFAAMVLAPLFPGTGWTDPEFEAAMRRPLGLAPQQLISYVLCSLVLLAVGFALCSTDSIAMGAGHRAHRSPSHRSCETPLWGMWRH